MADDPTYRPANDRARVNVNEGHGVTYWTQELGVNAETLRKLVAKYGPSADVIRQAMRADR